MTSKKEFQVGKHNIGYIDSEFESRVGGEFESRPMPTFQKLGRALRDTEIESELKPGYCELGGILAFLDNGPEECKDGYLNLFYTRAFVVGVVWKGSELGWRVYAWYRGACAWYATSRVFSPATDISKPLDSSETLSLESLNARIKELESWASSFRK